MNNISEKLNQAGFQFDVKDQSAGEGPVRREGHIR